VAGAVFSSTVIPQTGSIAILQDYMAEEESFKGCQVTAVSVNPNCAEQWDYL